MIYTSRRNGVEASSLKRFDAVMVWGIIKNAKVLDLHEKTLKKSDARLSRVTRCTSMLRNFGTSAVVPLKNQVPQMRVLLGER